MAAISNRQHIGYNRERKGKKNQSRPANGIRFLGHELRARGRRAVMSLRSTPRGQAN